MLNTPRNPHFDFETIEQMEANHAGETVGINRRIALASLTKEPQAINQDEIADDITHAIEQSIAHYSAMLKLFETAKARLGGYQAQTAQELGGNQ